MNELFLHPVLTSTDDAITPRLEKENNIYSIKQTTSDDYIIVVDLKVDDDYINNLIEEGKAEYFVEIDCDKSRYRRHYCSRKSHIEFAIPRQSVINKIIVRSSVLVKVPIEYCNPNANEDYEGITFRLSKGDSLVEFDGIRFTAELAYTMDNIFKVAVNENPEQKYVQYDLSQDKIRILLPVQDYNVFKGHKDDEKYRATFHSSILLNALLYTLYTGEFDKEPDDNDELWKVSIRHAVDNNELLASYNLSDKNNYHELAQVMLENPFSTLFDEIKSDNEENL